MSTGLLAVLGGSARPVEHDSFAAPASSNAYSQQISKILAQEEAGGGVFRKKQGKVQRQVEVTYVVCQK
jgi:hypothetical protein